LREHNIEISNGSVNSLSPTNLDQEGNEGSNTSSPRDGQTGTCAGKSGDDRSLRCDGVIRENGWIHWGDWGCCLLTHSTWTSSGSDGSSTFSLPGLRENSAEQGRGGGNAGVLTFPGHWQEGAVQRRDVGSWRDRLSLLGCLHLSGRLDGRSFAALTFSRGRLNG
jgi:hypothetical protein